MAGRYLDLVRRHESAVQRAEQAEQAMRRVREACDLIADGRQAMPDEKFRRGVAWAEMVIRAAVGALHEPTEEPAE